MGLFKKIPETVEAITFDELVDYGKANGGNIVAGMPWSFCYMGRPITHENDDCYLICVPRGTGKFYRGEILVTDSSGGMRTYKPEVFNSLYEPA